MEFGDILRQIRAERGLSQDELPPCWARPSRLISRYETKKRVPRLSVVTAFAAKARSAGFSALRRRGDYAAGTDARFRHAARADSGQRGLRRAIYKPGDGTEFVTVGGRLSLAISRSSPKAIP